MSEHTTRSPWGLDGATPDEDMPTCPDCGPGQTLHGQYYRHEEGDGYDWFDCPECGGEWSAENLDASSAYRQGVIDADPIAERVRLAAREARRRQLAKRAHVRRALRKSRRLMEGHSATWGEGFELERQTIRAMNGDAQHFIGGPRPVLVLGWRACALGMMAQHRRQYAAERRPWQVNAWQVEHESARRWNGCGGDRLPQ